MSPVGLVSKLSMHVLAHAPGVRQYFRPCGHSISVCTFHQKPKTRLPGADAAYGSVVDSITVNALYASRASGSSVVPVEMLLCIHFMQHGLTLSDPALEEAVDDMPLVSKFVDLPRDCDSRLKSILLWFFHLLEKHKWAEQMPQAVNTLRESIVPNGLFRAANTTQQIEDLRLLLGALTQTVQIARQGKATTQQGWC